jgi:hypothetical protein
MKETTCNVFRPRGLNREISPPNWTFRSDMGSNPTIWTDFLCCFCSYAVSCVGSGFAKD